MKLTILASPLADRDVLRRAERLADRFNLEPRIVTDPEDVPDSPTVALVATGGTEDTIEALLERSSAVLLLHWHSYNSLAAALEVGVSTLHVGRAEEAIRAFKRLVGTRILVVGGKCSWIRGPDPSDLPYLQTVEVDLEDVKSVDPDGSFEEKLRAHGIDPSELNRNFLDLAGKLHAVLSQYGANAITGDCFSLYEEFGAGSLSVLLRAGRALLLRGRSRRPGHDPANARAYPSLHRKRDRAGSLRDASRPLCLPVGVA
ncbi:hypothetical protein [Methanopyrus kandleri]|uniref:Uncharacterized protein n=1 Tax=Methanopyrus kandleri (strain AV19 / DSM 6324 / JCM 9639 / NBRC 100938) TaxID=190192 RepID=Q8TYV0_METKA|nr:hypothetical protein [Methanopyrus kandleri]AAM01408.1 Uncharacterized protein MK0191 [Methanopyrus kandleri AV19]